MKITSLRSILTKYGVAIFSSFALAITIFFIAPVGVYQANASALAFPLWNVIGIYLLAALAAFVALFGLCLIARPFFKNLPIVYTLLVILLWLQGNFLNYDLGLLNGASIEWEKFSKFHYLEAFILIALIGIYFVLQKYLAKKTNFILGCLLFMQAGPLLINAVTNSAPQERERPALIFDNSQEFDFSTEKNVVVIVLDSFRRDIFEEIITTRPDLGEKFQDFTLFRDVVSGYHQTYPSVPVILSGRYYDNTVSTTEYMEGAFNNSLPVLLKQNGYDTEAYSMFQELYGNAPDIWDNATALTWGQMVNDARKQFLLTSIRYSPLVFKPHFVDLYYEERGSNQIDLNAFKQQSSNVTISDRTPVFKWIHLRGVHPPFLIDENFRATPKEVRYSRDAYVGQATASLKAVINLLAHMKKSGVYDNSLIVVMADHGYPRFSTDVPKDYLFNRPLNIPDSLPYFGSPLLLIKDFSEHNETMATSDVPVASGDIAKTIADMLNLENDLPGVSAFSDEAAGSRVRKFFYYNGPDHKWGDPFFPMMYEYHITGPVWEMSSWEFTGKTYTSEGQEEFVYPVYPYGSNIIESIVAKADAFLTFGISYDKVNQFYNWASAPLACIYLPVEPVNRELELSFTGAPFLADDLQDQTMNVYIDQAPAGTFTKTSDMNVKIPADQAIQVTADHQFELCMEFPDVKKSPMDYGMSTDLRLLGYHFQSIILK